jgi:hypothetical protein
LQIFPDFLAASKMLQIVFRGHEDLIDSAFVRAALPKAKGSFSTRMADFAANDLFRHNATYLQSFYAADLLLAVGVAAVLLDELDRPNDLFVAFDFGRFPKAHSGPSAVLVEELDAGGSKANRGCWRIAAKVWQPPDEKRARDPL